MQLFLCLDLGDGSFRKGEGDHCRLAPACLCSSLADAAALQASSIRLFMSSWRLAVTPKALDTAVALLQAVLRLVLDQQVQCGRPAERSYLYKLDQTTLIHHQR